MNNKLIYVIIVFVSLSQLLNNTAFGQKKLNIGDSIPEIKYSKWLQGDPIPTIRDGKIYVLEFWATWCGACIASMGHLSELSKKYDGKAVFLGVNVLEQTKKNKPYEATLPKIMSFINSDLNKMTFPAFADNNDEYISKNFLEPTSSNGLPTTFVVKEGRLIWIGHPAALDNLMDKFIDGSYDMKSFKLMFDKKKEAIAAFRLADEELNRILEAGNYDKALEIYEKGISESPSPYYKIQKFKLLAEHYEKGKASDYFAHLIKTKDSGALEIVHSVATMENLPNEIYDMAIGVLNNEYPSYYLLARKANIYINKGDKKQAIKALEQAINAAEKEFEKQPNDMVVKKNIGVYKERLNEFNQMK